MQVRTIRLRITGRVQGVGYRDALRREAERLGVTGWVRNMSDGSVEAVVQGSADALRALQHWAHTGPGPARVERVEAGPPAPEHSRHYARFERWPSG